jgi:hypothetical protein
MSEVYSCSVEKYSLGRSTGLTAHNWKKRHFAVTSSTLSYADKAGATPKLEVPLSAVSLLFTRPGKQEHPMAGGSAPMLVIRFHESGVFNLLLKLPGEEEKERLVQALQQALVNSKGFQIF